MPQNEANLEHKLTRILLEQNLSSDDIKAQLSIAAQRRERGVRTPHSMYLRAFDASGKALFLKVMVWRSAEFRRTRLRTAEDHHQLHEALQRRPTASFRIPAPLASGDSPLVWDLSELVQGETLPWYPTRNHNLDTHVDKASHMFEIARDLSKIPLDVSETKTAQTLADETRQKLRWAQQRTLLGSRDAARAEIFIERFENLDAMRCRPALVHGDFTPGNVLWPETGKPWLIDFDHMRRTIIGDALGQTISARYSESAWTKTVLDVCKSRLSGPEYRGVILGFMWHAFNAWQGTFRYDVGPSIKTPTALAEARPQLMKRIASQRRLLRLVLREELSALIQ